MRRAQGRGEKVDQQSVPGSDAISRIRFLKDPPDKSTSNFKDIEPYSKITKFQAQTPTADTRKTHPS